MAYSTEPNRKNNLKKLMIFEKFMNFFNHIGMDYCRGTKGNINNFL